MTKTLQKFDVVQWFAEQGKTCYQTEIKNLETEIAKNVGDEFSVKKLNDEIEEVRRQAQDRYDDWVSDLDYC